MTLEELRDRCTKETALLITDANICDEVMAENIACLEAAIAERDALRETLARVREVCRDWDAPEVVPANCTIGIAETRGYELAVDHCQQRIEAALAAPGDEEKEGE